jgi:hypothetical protein
MANLDKDYNPDSNNNDLVFAVKTDTEDQQESLHQILLRESAPVKSKVNSIKQV